MEKDELDDRYDGMEYSEDHWEAFQDDYATALFTRLDIIPSKLHLPSRTVALDVDSCGSKCGSREDTRNECRRIVANGSYQEAARTVKRSTKMSKCQIKTDVQRRASESYQDMKARQQKEINGFPKAFAFSDRQFAEGMRALGLDPADKDKIVFIGGGGFIRKTDEGDFQAMFQRHRLGRKAAMDADQTGDGDLLEMFRCELSNHEYGYTRDAEPALMVLGVAWEDIGGDERLMHAFETACRQEAEWYDRHCGV